MNEKKGTLLAYGLLGAYLLLLFYLLSVAFLPIPKNTSSFLYASGRFLGLAGFFSLAILIISGDVARYLDRYFGMDRIIKFQRRFSYIASALVVFHPLLFIAAAKNTRLLQMMFTSPLPAAGGLAFLLLIIILVCSILYKKISHNAWQVLHILTYALFILGIYHALGHNFINQDLGIRVLYIVSAIGFVLGVSYRSWYKLFRKPLLCSVEKIKKETPDTITLFLKPPKKLKFTCGQFFFLRIKKNHLYARHPFTVASAPDDKLVQFTIKDSGRFTKTVRELKKGEMVLIEGPFGTFTPKRGKKVFIAGGVGITPFLCMLRHLMQSGSKDKVILLYGSKTKKDIIAEKELRAMRAPWLKIVHVLSREKIKGYENGRLSKKLLTKYVKNPKSVTYYICGPEPMKDMLFKELKTMGVKKRNIKFESFFW